MDSQKPETLLIQTVMRKLIINCLFIMWLEQNPALTLDCPSDWTGVSDWNDTQHQVAREGGVRALSFSLRTVQGGFLIVSKASKISTQASSHSLSLHLSPSVKPLLFSFSSSCSLCSVMEHQLWGQHTSTWLQKGVNPIFSLLLTVWICSIIDGKYIWRLLCTDGLSFPVWQL